MLELESKSDRIQHCAGLCEAQPTETLSVGELAEVASLSPRQFSRTIPAETGQSPARPLKAFESLRRGCRLSSPAIRRFDSKAFNGLCRRLAGLSPECAAELPRAETGDFRNSPTDSVFRRLRFA